MAAVGFIRLDTTESAKKTVLSRSSTTMGLKDALIKNATSRSIFHFSIQETGRYASSVRIITMIQLDCLFADRIA